MEENLERDVGRCLWGYQVPGMHQVFSDCKHQLLESVHLLYCYMM